MNGADLIAQERQRQIDGEGYDAGHDDEHDMGELAAAAMCYADLAVDVEISAIGDKEFTVQWWPFADNEWKPSDDVVRDLTKAGALIAAEIDRLQRKRGAIPPSL